MVEPAVQGTRYVIEAAADAGTVRVNFNKGNKKIHQYFCCKKIKHIEKDYKSRIFFIKYYNIYIFKFFYYYFLYNNLLDFSLTTAEERGIELAVVIPVLVLVLGQLLQPTLNASAMHVMKYLDWSARKYANAVQGYTDVRDVAEAHVPVYEAEGAAGKRFLCADRVLHRQDLVRILVMLFPRYPVLDK
ncbi:unnamed protein product [Musa textilis]